MLVCIFTQSLWGTLRRRGQNNQIEQKQTIEMEEQNARVHGLVLEISLVKQIRNNPNVKHFIGKDLRW